MTRFEDKRKHQDCPNCGQRRTEGPWQEDVDQYAAPEDFPHDTLLECINYLRSVTEDLTRRLENHRL